MKICVVDSSAYATLVAEQLTPGATLYWVQDMQAVYSNFVGGNCQVLVGDQFETAYATVQNWGYVKDYKVGANIFSKEPLALVTRQEDPTWSDFVNWIIQALLNAENQTITQSNADVFQRIQPVFGDRYKNMFADAVAEVGHYGEVYNRSLEEFVPRKTVNTINAGATGLLYATPLGSVVGDGASTVVGSTLQKIRNNGHLQCGIFNRAFASLQNYSSGEYSGFCVDFCRTLSAAIFDGNPNSVQYTIITPANRFLLLANEQVDVLSCTTSITLSRDVYLSEEHTGFSFSLPIFYEYTKFGGIPLLAKPVMFSPIVLLRNELDPTYRFFTYILPFLRHTLLSKLCGYAQHHR